VTLASVASVGFGVELKFCIRASSSSLKSLGVGDKSRSNGAALALGDPHSAPALVVSYEVLNYNE
jgi:hypothetical protein